MKKLHSLMLVAVFLSLGSIQIARASNCPELDYSDDISIYQRFSLFRTTFQVESNGQKLGSARSKILSWTTTYTYNDEQGRLVAKGKMAAFSWGVRINITDCNGRRIGSIKEEVFRSLFSPLRTVYSILDSSGNAIAISEKTELFRTTIVLKDQSGYPVAELSRPGFRWRERWDIKVYNPLVDPRILIMIGIFKSDADLDREDEREPLYHNQEENL